ncbi:MAG TPA: VCBS repeat-containing protein, partial [Pyrinomonadaceae bacterium]|nr:VCBS repeat-containing protein [Pyrinomonadaceae bacterium]
MRLGENFLRRQAVRLTALVLVVGAYGLARVPAAPEEELARLAARFRFSAAPLPTLEGETPKTIREVNPSLRRIAGWVSAVGAAVALHDLDADGLPNDICYVDTRIDRVVVAPAPGTPPRYVPFSLDARPLPYDASTTAPMGCLPGDFDEDGRTDLLAYYWGRTPVVFLRQAAGPLAAASYQPHELVGTSERWFTNAATQADIDGDGHTDLVIGNYFPDGARILDARSTVPDEMQESMSLASNGGGPRFLIRKRPAPASHAPFAFEDVRGLLEGRAARGWTLAVAAGDLDGDLLPELYLANDFGPDRLLHNRSAPGAPRFALAEGRRGLTTPKSKVVG